MRGVLAGAFFGAETFVPLMLVTERDSRPRAAGLALTGGALGWAGGSWFQGRSNNRVPRYLLVRAGCLLVALGIAMIALSTSRGAAVRRRCSPGSSAGAGMGMSMASVSLLTLQLSPPAGPGGRTRRPSRSRDSLFSVVFIGVAGAIYGAAFAAGSGSESTFVTIWLTMAAVAAGGAVVAARIARPALAA